MKRPHLLIVGCGDIGCRVAPLLLAHGWLVSGLSRSPDRLPDSLSNRIQGDYTKPESLSAASELGADYLLFTPTPTAFDQAGYQQGYAEGARFVASVLAPQTRHIMTVSSTRVYAEREGGWVDEESAVASADPFVAALLSAEDHLRRVATTTVIRPSGLYDGANPSWLREVMAGKVSSTVGQYSNRIHRDDLAHIIAELLMLVHRGESIPATLNANDDEPSTIGSIEKWCLEALSISPAGERASANRANRRVSNQRLRALGISLKYPSFREGYAVAINNAQMT